jgi:hypothetical protein
MPMLMMDVREVVMFVGQRLVFMHMFMGRNAIPRHIVSVLMVHVMNMQMRV